MTFRNLKPEEIECRVGQMKRDGSGCSLLLYKTSRTDANILDEELGSENWQIRHYEVKGKDFAEVSIKINDEWVSKSDCGSESNIEAQKGESSDAMKRACFMWGIGRALYSTPDIWVKLEQGEASSNNGGRYQLSSSVYFAVKSIEYDETGNICQLSIEKVSNYGKERAIAFTWSNGKAPLHEFDCLKAYNSLAFIFDKILLNTSLKKNGVQRIRDLSEEKFNLVKQEMFDYVRTNSNKG